jgi:hypothetical protein
VVLTLFILPRRTGNRVKTLIPRDVQKRDFAGFGVEQARLMRMVVGE